MDLSNDVFIALALYFMVPVAAAGVGHVIVTRRKENRRAWWRRTGMALGAYYGVMATIYGIIYGYFFMTGEELLVLQVLGCGGILGAPVVAVLIITSASMQVSRKGSCRSCGYSLRGVGSEVCPECGRAISAPRDSR